MFRFFLKKEKITPERVELLRSWRHSGFNVSSDRRIPQGERLELERLLQYMERPPVSLERLEYQSDGRVLYRGKFNPSLQRDYQLSSALEFLAMLVPHVALRYECRIHSYGASSTTIRRQLGWIKKDEDGDASHDVVVVEDEDSEFVKLRRKNWARLIAKVYVENPALCGGCGQEMKVISALTSPHQDDVIERILRHRGQWDPPWKRDRKIRGPPRQLEILTQTAEDFSQVLPEAQDEFSQVPPGDDADL